MEETFKVSKLSGPNYFNWVRRAKAFFEMKKLLDFVVNDEITTPENKSQKDEAYFILLNLIEDKILSSFPQCEDAYSLWFQLEKTFSKVGETDVTRLTKNLYETKLGENLDVELYISMLQDIFCRLAGAGCTMTDESKITALLNGLPASFNSFAIGCEVMESNLKTFDFLASKLRNGVKMFKPVDETEKLMSISVQKEKTYCYICEKEGHTALAITCRPSK